MKVGIIALLRQSISVTHYTNKEIWDWCFHDFSDGEQTSKLLSIKLRPYEPRKATNDPLICEDVRKARRNANRHTTVIVQGNRELEIQFSDYLFLIHPPAVTVLKTSFGSILTGEDHRSKIYVKGIFVEEHDIRNPPPLAYGVDFNEAQLDRDRRFITILPITRLLAMMWNELISQDDFDIAAAMYLKLLLDRDETLEILEAKRYISRISAKKLFQQLCVMTPGRFFYNSEDPNSVEVPEMIEYSLN